MQSCSPTDFGSRSKSTRTAQGTDKVHWRYRATGKNSGYLFHYAALDRALEAIVTAQAHTKAA